MRKITYTLTTDDGRQLTFETYITKEATRNGIFNFISSIVNLENIKAITIIND